MCAKKNVGGEKVSDPLLISSREAQQKVHKNRQERKEKLLENFFPLCDFGFFEPGGGGKAP